MISDFPRLAATLPTTPLAPTTARQASRPVHDSFDDVNDIAHDRQSAMVLAFVPASLLVALVCTGASAVGHLLIGAIAPLLSAHIH